MASLRIQIFGAFRVWRDGEALAPNDWNRQWTRQLLKLLLTRPNHPFSRDEIAAALWPDASADAISRNARVTVSLLRRVLEPDLARGTDSQFILRRREGYLFDTGADCWIDVLACDELQRSADAARDEGRLENAAEGYERALDLASDEVLSEDTYEPWASDLRRHWHERRIALHAAAAECRARLGTYPAAEDLCLRALELDPTREDLYRQLMLYQYCSGQRGRALRSYRRCRDVLEQELGVRPSEPTQALRTEIEARHVAGVDRDRTYPTPPSIKNLPYSLGRTPFVGRTSERSWLARRLGAAERGRGGIVVVEGEAGVGKTRLIEQFLDEASDRRVRMLVGRAFEREVGISLEPILTALEGLAVAAPDDVQRTRLDDMAPASAGLETSPEAGRTFQALTAALIGAVDSDHDAVVLFVDDLHWADAATLDFLAHAALRLHDQPVLLIGTYRLEHRAELASWLARLGEHRAVETRTLTRLSPDDTLQLVTRMSSRGFAGSADLTSLLHRESEGNPFFALEYMRWLIENRAVEMAEDGTIAAFERERPLAGALPTGVFALIHARLDGLEPAAREVAELAAVVGRDVPHGLLMDTAPDPETVSSAIATLKKRGILVDADDEGYRFSHDKIRHATYAAIGSQDLRERHLRVASALSERGADPAELAHHYLRAAAWRPAAEHLLRAARRAEARQAWENALALYGRMLEVMDRLPDSDERRFDVLAAGERLLERLGARAEQTRAVREMFELATSLGDRTRLGEALVRSIGVADDPAAAAERAIRHFREDDDVEGQARAQRALGYALWRAKRFRAAQDANFRALELHRRVGNRAGAAGDATNIAQVYLNLDELDEALRWAEDAAAGYQRLGDEAGYATVSWHVAAVHRRRGDAEAALRWTKEGLARHHDQGFFSCIKHAECGLLNLSLGRPEEAIAHFRCAARDGAKVGATRDEGHAVVGIGMSLQKLGDHRGAAKAYRKGLDLMDLASRSGPRETVSAARVDAQVLLAELLHRTLDRPDEAARLYEDAAQLLRAQKGGDRSTLTKVLLALGGLHWSADAFEASKQAFEQAAAAARATGDEVRLTASLLGLSVVCLNLDEPRAATEMGRSAARRASRVGDAMAEAYAWRSAGDGYRRIGRKLRAATCLRRSLRLRIAVGDVEGAASVQEDLERLCPGRSSYAAATPSPSPRARARDTVGG